MTTIRTSGLVDEYARAMGLQTLSREIELNSEDVERRLLEVRRQHPEDTPEQQYARAVARELWFNYPRLCRNAPAEPPQVPPPPELPQIQPPPELPQIQPPPPEVQAVTLRLTMWQKLLLYLWMAVALGLLGVIAARGQGGQGPMIEALDEGLRVRFFAAGVFRWNCIGVGVTCTWNAGTRRVDLTVAGGIGGSGTLNYLPKFTAATTLGDSLLSDIGNNLRYGGTTTQIPTLLSNLQGSDPDFTVVDYPDTQNYADLGLGATLQMWKDQTIWTVANKIAWNIVAVAHTGDVVHSATAVQFTAMNGDATYGFVQLDNAAIPYTPAPGNHDYTSTWTRDLTGAGKWNATFPSARYSGAAWYLGSDPAGSVESMAIKFDVGTSKYGILSLGLCPSNGQLAWAQGILNLDTARKFIVSTHAFLLPAGGLATTGDLDACENYLAAGFNQPLAIWTNFIQANDSQIMMVLNGHFFQGGAGPNGESTAYDLQVGANGHIIPMVHTNFQAYTNGGSGYMRIFKFRPSLGLIEVKTYSPNLTTYLTDAGNEYNLPFGEVSSKAVLTSTLGGLVVNGRLHTSDVDLRLGRLFHVYDTSAKESSLIHSLRLTSAAMMLNSTGSLYLNYDRGTGGTYFGNGAGVSYARVASTGVFTSTVATGTAPLSIVSTTEVPTLNIATWHGKVALDFSGALDFGSIAAQTCLDLTIAAITGAATGNAVAPVWPSTLEANLSGTMFVSAADTVTVRLCNPTVGAIDPASQTFGGRVIK